MMSSIAGVAAGVAALGGGFFGFLFHHGPLPQNASSTPPMMATSTEGWGDHMPPPPNDRMGTSIRPDWTEGSSTRPIPPPPMHPRMATSTMPMMHDMGNMQMATSTDMDMATSTEQAGTPPPPPKGFFAKLLNFFGHH